MSDMENAEVKKHVAAIHINNKLSLLQHKIANILLLYAYDDLLTREVHSIKITSLARLAGFDSNDHDVLKKALTALAETTIQWNILDSAGKNGQWGVSTLLAQAVIERGACRYAYSPELRRKLYNPEVYARINILIQRTFSSGYALKLYENCIRYRGTGSTGWWTISTFKALLGLGENEYSNFKDLNKWIIKPSVNQVNQHSDILIEVEYKREKRRIVALRFQIKASPQLSIPLSIRSQLSSEADAEALLDLNRELTQSSAPKRVLERLQEFGFSDKQAQAAIKKFGEAYVMENLDIVEKDYLSGKVLVLPAYTRSALQEDYRPKLSRLERVSQVEKGRTDEVAVNRDEAKDTLEGLQRDFRKARLQKVLEELPAHEYESLKLHFEESNKSNPLFRRWLKRGFEHPVMQSLFRAFASEKLLKEPEEDEFVRFAESQAVNLAALRAEAGVVEEAPPSH
ncbi:MAG: replication initiation protein [Gammaproteobacteria bacterium]|nr:replication initiation protein [Gammaproteobacteria bacterium]MCP5426095.1 replication initiation protein [Gammaproteobacteria bacterium]